MSQTETLYTYHLSGRRFSVVFALLASVAFTYACFYHQTPWYMFLPCGISVLMCVWAIIANPQTSSTLTNHALTFNNRGKTWKISIENIAYMRVQNWTDGPDTVTLFLKDGKRHHIPGLCADSGLAKALRALGIAEVQS